ncbi:MAG: 3'-5' exoribonuclease [Candidatus Delongbacteria bacterium]|nr:3'-5' exoribonuclease [Candidatus Delongbacteria bacterium]MBN2836447.1 3'-5' exoribonuclease [Candidatus Delongbacteria bacterium]
MSINSSDLRHIRLNEFVAIDIETTGLNTYVDKIIEIAAVRFVDGEKTDTFQTFIDPGMKLPDEISQITGIRDDDLIGKPEIDKVLPSFFEFIGTSPLVGHNISFDLEFLKYYAAVYGVETSFRTAKVHDTLLLSQIFFPKGPISYKLSVLKDFFGFDGNDHRALDDSITCGNILLRIAEEAVSLSDEIVKNLAEVSLGFEFVGKQFILDLANFYGKTSFNRKLGVKQKKYSDSYNFIIKDSELNEEMKKVLLTDDIIDKIFLPGGLLDKNIKKFEYREEQYTFAKAAFEAYKNNKILVTEAGTGVGKSFAYLFPSAINAVLNDEKVVITTNTKNLQEQIFYKDIPVIHQLLGGIFSSVILKGRNNYLCINRYESVLRHPTNSLNGNEQAARFLPLVVWAGKTATGDIEENSGFKKGYNYDIWNKVESDSSFCLGKKCKHYNSCHAIGIRKKAFKSDLVIINHSLLFSDIISDSAVLGQYSHLVVDEAHNIENAATNYLGEEFSFNLIRNICNRIITSDNKHGNLIKLERAIATEIKDKNLSDKIIALIDQLKDKNKVLYEVSKSFFDQLGQNLLSKNYAESNSLIKKRFKDSEEIFGDFEHEKEKFKSVFEDHIGLIKRIDHLLNTFDENPFPDHETIKQEFVSINENALGAYSTFNFFNDTSRENFVFWYELGIKDGNVSLKLSSAPLDVSPILKDNLYENLSSVILTSATLTIERRFKYMQKKLGLAEIDPDKIETLMLGSPFNLKKQLRVITPSFIASPKMSAIYEKDVENILGELIENFDQGTLVLFTSYKLMSSMAYKLRDKFKKTGRTLLVQGKESTRTDLVKNFKKIRNSFLFGTDSFWEGVDVPGDALEALVIVKLPFSVPTEPVIEARIEEIEKSGNNSFMHYSVPEAILKFKQGIGRLIRTADDYGAVYILDSRVINTRWGQAFVNSLPVLPEIPKNLQNLKTITEEIFGEKL